MADSKCIKHERHPPGFDGLRRFVYFPASQHPACRIRVTSLPQTESGEHKVKFDTLMIGTDVHAPPTPPWARGSSAAAEGFVAEGDPCPCLLVRVKLVLRFPRPGCPVCGPSHTTAPPVPPCWLSTD